MENGFSRRHLLGMGATAALGMATAGFAPRLHAVEDPVETSDLIYLSPLRSNGELSSCHAEVWFQAHKGALYVVTAADAWRAKAVGRGLANTRIWVGDVGAWKDSDGAYLKLPAHNARARLEQNTDIQAEVLEKMGSKYRMSWLVWGPRFRNGLADGSRVMLRYEFI